MASMAIIVLSLIQSAPTASAAPRKKCIEIKEDYDLRNAARESDVFLIVHESADSDMRKKICEKLEATPEKRMKAASEKGRGAVFAYMEIKDPYEDDDGEWQDGNRGFAKNSLGAKSFPSVIYLTKGMDRNSKFIDHVTHYKGGSSDSLELADVEKFVEKKVGFKVGNDVYNIIFFDTIAARFVSYGDATGMDSYKQRALALLVRFSTLFSFREPFASIGKLYNRAFSMSFANGMDYCEKQTKKLQKKLDTNKSNLSQDKIHEFQQKIAVLKAFAEPKELTDDDDKQILKHAALHFGLLIATILLLVVPDSKEKEEEEEVANAAEPVVAKKVGDDKDDDEKRE